MDDTQLIAVVQRDGFLPAGKVDAAGRAAAIDAVLLDNRIDLLRSCLSVRRKRGDATRSMHRRRIAVDVDPGRNPLRSNRHLARTATADCLRTREIWEDEGWVSLRRARDGGWTFVGAVGWDVMPRPGCSGPSTAKGRWMHGMIRRCGYVGWAVIGRLKAVSDSSNRIDVTHHE